MRDSDYLQKMNRAELSEYQIFKSNEMPYRFNENCSVRPITLGLRVRILISHSLKQNRHWLVPVFIAGAGFEPATFGL